MPITAYSSLFQSISVYFSLSRYVPTNFSLFPNPQSAIFNSKIQWEMIFFPFLKLLIKKIWTTNSYVIRYTFQSNLLLKRILDLGKCPNQKMHESEIAGFLLWALLEVQNQFPKQIWLKCIPNYITKELVKKFLSVLINK